MKKFGVVLCTVALLAAVGSTAWAASTPFLADTNQLGYLGSVTNLTQGTGPSIMPTPRDAALDMNNFVPQTIQFPVAAPFNGNSNNGYYSGGINGFGGDAGNYNEFNSNWWQHPVSNQNPGFFQLFDQGNFTVTSATGVWTQEQSGLWDFTLRVTGAGASYENSWARLWQSDAGAGAGDAWGGTFTNYSYTLTATGMQTAIVDDWRVNTTDPFIGPDATGTITGTFDGTFVATYDYNLNPISNGNTYQVHLDFSNTTWDGTDWNDQALGYNYGLYSQFGAPIPEPLTMAGVLLGIGALGRYWSRKHRAVG